MEEARINVRTDIQGLDAAIAKFGMLSSNVNDTQRAMRGIYGTAQGAERVPGGGGVVSPQQMEQMQRHIDTLKRGEAEINRLIEKRKADLKEIQSREFQLTPAQQFYWTGAIKSGMNPVEMLKAHGGVPPELQKMLAGEARLQKEIGGLESRRAGIQEAIPQAEMLGKTIGVKMADTQERVLERWLPKLASTLTSVIGLGGAMAIAGQSYNRAVQFAVQMSDIRGFVGGSRGRGLNAGALQASGPYGLYPNEAGQIAGDLLASGYKGDFLPGLTQEFAGAGMAFGLGRRGYATMAAQGVGSGKFQNLDTFRRFGATAGAMAVSNGLEPGQRSYFIEAHKNLIEQMTVWYGGRPLNTDNYWRAMNGLMTAMRGLGLPMGGSAVATQIMSTFAQGMTPIGKSFPDLITRGALLGLKPGGNQGLYLGTQRAILDMLSGPAPLQTGLQGVARTMGISTGPGAQISGGQLDSFIAVLKEKFPELATSVDIMASVGTDMREFLSTGVGELPADINDKMAELLKNAKEGAEDSWKREDIAFVRKEIEGLGAFLKDASTLVKRIGPTGLVAGSATTSLLTPFIGPLFAGAAGAGVGAVIGGAEALFGTISGNLGPVKNAIVGAATKYGINPALALGLAKTESSFNPKALNRSSGAAGLFQIMPENQRRYGMTDPFDPTQSADIGMRILSENIQRHGGDVDKALADYGGFKTKDPTEYIAQIFRDAANEIVRMLSDNTRSLDQNTAATNSLKGGKIKTVGPMGR